MRLADLHNGDMFEVTGIRDKVTLAPLTFIMQNEEQLKNYRVVLHDNKHNRSYIVSVQSQVTLVNKPRKERIFNYSK